MSMTMPYSHEKGSHRRSGEDEQRSVKGVDEERDLAPVPGPFPLFYSTQLINRFILRRANGRRWDRAAADRESALLPGLQFHGFLPDLSK